MVERGDELGGVVRRQTRPNYLSLSAREGRWESSGARATLPKICAPLRNNGRQTPITDHHTCVRSHVAARSHRPQGARAIPAPTGQSIPAQGSALGIRPRTFPHSNGTPQIVASPTRARTMRRSFRAHPYLPSVSRMHTHRSRPGCMPTVRVPDAYPPSVSRMHTPRPCPGCIPAVRVPDAYPPSTPQGCTLGWYALPLWVKWNPSNS